MTPAQEAAAFHGSAMNPVYSLSTRLACALKALEFYTMPHRDDAVAEWIKAARDRRDPNELLSAQAHAALDDLLDDYRLHADTGTPLDEDVTDGPGEPRENGSPDGQPTH